MIALGYSVVKVFMRVMARRWEGLLWIGFDGSTGRV